MTRASVWAVSAVALLGSACTRGETADSAAQAEAAAQAPQPPDTTGASLWAHLQQANYRASWSTWPGKGRLYRGSEPHGALLTTYVNGIAHDALTGKAGRMPAGAIVVKENYAPDSTFGGATVMYKVAGYDAAAADWFWVKFLPDGTVDMGGEAQGRVPMCIQCHGGARANDYLFTGSIQ